MRSQSTFSLLFWVNTSRAKNNQSNVYARITVNDMSDTSANVERSKEKLVLDHKLLDAVEPLKS